jgi:hypothetical protein
LPNFGGLNQAEVNREREFSGGRIALVDADVTAGLAKIAPP